MKALVLAIIATAMIAGSSHVFAQSASAPPSEAILKRLDALENENRALRDRIQHLEAGKRSTPSVAASTTTPVVTSAGPSLSGTSAMAMATKAPMSPALGAYSWTGFYVGANIGYAWQNDITANYSANDPMARLIVSGLLGGGSGPPIPPASLSTKGVTGGLQLGYNWQVNQSFLLGLETDFSGSSIEGTGNSTFAFTPGVPGSIAVNQKVDWWGTVRARFGWLPTNSWLVYGTGGIAYGHVNENATLVQSGGGFGNVGGFSFSCNANAPCFVGSSSRIAAGWTAGAGTEYLVARNLTLRAEYLYVNLGDSDSYSIVATPQAGFAPSSLTVSHSQTKFNTVRFGLNYKFY